MEKMLFINGGKNEYCLSMDKVRGIGPLMGIYFEVFLAKNFKTTLEFSKPEKAEEAWLNVFTKLNELNSVLVTDNNVEMNVAMFANAPSRAYAISLLDVAYVQKSVNDLSIVMFLGKPGNLFKNSIGFDTEENLNQAWGVLQYNLTKLNEAKNID